MKTYFETNMLTKQIIRVPKAHSSFLYFTLESHEGLAFYSTLSSSLGKEYRDVEIYCPTELERELDHLFEQCRISFAVEVLDKQTILDSQ